MNGQLKASTSNRILATVIDVIIMYILMIGISSLAVNPIIRSTTNYDEQYELYEATLLSSNLAVKNENEQLTVYCYDFKVDKINEYEGILVDFYIAHQGEEDKVKEFYDSKKATTNVFDYDETTNTFTLKENVEDSASVFYNNEFNKALNYLYNTNEAYREAHSTISFYMNFEQYFSLVVSATVVFLLMPVIFKNGKTIGKKLFKLSLSKTDNVFTPVKFTQVLIRYLAILIIEIICSELLGFIPVLISIITLTLTDKHFALHDYIAKTYVINDKAKDGVEAMASIIKNDVVEAEVLNERPYEEKESIIETNANE